MAGDKNFSSGIQPDSAVHISFEDQQRINKFARQNAKMEDFKDELKQKQNDLQNLNDACSELELCDDDAIIPFHVGEVFVNQNLEKTLACLEEAKVKKTEEISVIEEKLAVLKNASADLKAELYAKFGNNINLEVDDD